MATKGTAGGKTETSQLSRQRGGLHKASHSQVPQLQSQFNLAKDSRSPTNANGLTSASGSLAKVNSLENLAKGQEVIASVGEQDSRLLKGLAHKGRASQAATIDATSASK